MVLKMHGALTSGQVGEMLQITGEAARQQLLKLLEDGLVTEERRSAGRGRPAVHWHLTQAGQARFPDTHAALSVEILRSISDVLGPDALDQIIAAREAGTETRYKAAMAECTDLQDRVTKLAELRSIEGYMATVEETGDGAFRLIENHCPICAAATFCQGFCRAEKAVFKSILGKGTSVERVEHIVDGGRRCTYLISEARP
ncbi:Predicted transcriptional regulator, ArsR family [Lutimaribacter pacificus]|uniref:Transcriptional regulator n=1 Tax=Lutimaribacter pacificus TaxID=391948 RepID=A0A1H0NTY8_9RHOB|nr:metalloregulator ArsR/SmtB family transcription factor [Lutimaribacter pacificus]SDO96217.1 Predicted transcriptional regulator, ArsR family [Lutimaribacter pacificus]SHK95103.1 transcriptional regulator [Lutimaribacter pacificus]